MELALIGKSMENHQKKILAQNMIDTLNHQIEEIELGTLREGTKQKLISGRNSIIRDLEVYRDQLQLL
jgi:hypothetical protein